MEITLNTARIGACAKKTFGPINGPKCKFKFVIFTDTNELMGYGHETIDMSKSEDIDIYSQMLISLKRMYLMAGTLNFCNNLIGKTVREITYEDLESLLTLASGGPYARERFLNAIWRCLAVVVSYNSRMAFSDFLLSAEIEAKQ